MRLERRGVIILDDPETDPIIFEDREELAEELALLDSEILNIPSGQVTLYPDGTLYSEKGTTLWREAGKHTWLDDEVWAELWAKAREAIRKENRE